jgi:sodium transport system permease protein
LIDPRFTAVLRCELARLVRDRRALFLAVVLPMLLYPLYFLGGRMLGAEAERRMEDQAVALLVDTDALPDEVELALAEALLDVPNLSFQAAPFGAGADPADVEALEQRLRAAGAAEDTSGWLVARAAAPATAGTDAERAGGAEVGAEVGADAPGAADGAAAADAAALELVLFFDGSGEQGLELASRVGDAVEGVGEAHVARALAERLPVDPADTFAHEPLDVAAPADAAGASLGRWLPLVCVLILVSGGAYAALDAFAAEREQGTLETLLVQPVPARLVAWAKFCAVALCAALALLGNLGSLLGSAAGGLVPVGDGAAGSSAAVLGGVFTARLALALLLALPGAALVCAVLCAVSARARTYREAQSALLPLTLGALVATAPATLPGVELVPTLAVVPLVGSALAMREALAGHLALAPALLSMAASSAAALLALRHVGRLLDLEGLLQHGDTAAEGEARERRARRALRFGWAAVFAIYFVGGWLQARSLALGLGLTLWVLALGIAVALAIVQRREERTHVLFELGLVPPRALAFASVPLLVLGLAALAEALLTWQSTVLPLPPGLADSIGALSDLGPVLGLFLLAVTPGICEELLFRGAIQTGLQREFSPRKAILWQAVLFGLAHASIHRLLVTTAIGVVLGVLRWRTGSVLPGILVHALYNALLVSVGAGWIAQDSRLAEAATGPWSLAFLPLGLLVALLAVRKR